MTRSIAPEILAKLEPYLEGKAIAWDASARMVPTLPSTVDAKVNVRGIVAELGLPVHNAQHFFKHPEIRSAVNAVAQHQGLKPIGARNEQQEADAAVEARLKQAGKRSSDLAQLVAEQAATIEWQRREIASLREQLKVVEETGQIVRFGPVS